MIELTQKQRQELDGPAPARVRDPKTNATYVLVPAEVYDRLQSLFNDDRLTEEERRAIVKGVWKRAGWDDPAMDDYAALDPRKE